MVTSNVSDGEETAANALWRRYTVTCSESHRLGKGAFGAVYLATDKETKEVLAVKKVDPPLDEKRERCIRAIQEECRILETLDHENIIRIKNHGFGIGDESRPLTISC